MNMIWAGVKATAGIVGQAAVETGMKGKLQTELMLINREIENRKRSFGEELYGYVEPLSKNPNFFAANDRMTETLRGPLLTAQREISALDLKRGKIIAKISQNESKEREQGAYVSGTTVMEKVQNAAIKTGFASNHAKLKTELAMVDTQIKDFKQQFGLEIFQVFVDLEDMEGWLPTVRDIRSIYDQARRDIEKIQERRKNKEEELTKLGGVSMTNSSEKSQYNEPTVPEPSHQENRVANEYFHQAAGAESSNVPTTISAGNGVQGYGATNGSTAYGVNSNEAVQAASYGNGNGFGANAAARSGGYGSAAPQTHDPFQGSVGAGQTSQLYPPPAAAAPDPFAAAAPPTNTAFSFMNDNSEQSLGSSPAMGTGGGFGGAPTIGGFGTAPSRDPFSSLAAPPTHAAPQSANDDPFSAFDSLQGQQQQPGQQPSNPLFRY